MPSPLLRGPSASFHKPGVCCPPMDYALGMGSTIGSGKSAVSLAAWLQSKHPLHLQRRLARAMKVETTNAQAPSIVVPNSTQPGCHLSGSSCTPLMTMSSSILTIGYGGRSTDDLLATLKREGVRFLIDVRSDPVSRFNPEFSAEPLRETLQ
jgi:hypothetical protein